MESNPTISQKRIVTQADQELLASLLASYIETTGSSLAQITSDISNMSIKDLKSNTQQNNPELSSGEIGEFFVSTS